MYFVFWKKPVSFFEKKFWNTFLSQLSILYPAALTTRQKLAALANCGFYHKGFFCLQTEFHLPIWGEVVLQLSPFSSTPWTCKPLFLRVEGCPESDYYIRDFSRSVPDQIRIRRNASLPFWSSELAMDSLNWIFFSIQATRCKRVLSASFVVPGSMWSNIYSKVSQTWT